MQNVLGSTTLGYVSGKYQQEILVCEYPRMASSKGIWFHDNPLACSGPLLSFQIILIFITSRFIYFLFRPLRQSLIITQILAGILLGPSSPMGQHNTYLMMVFHPAGILVIKTLSGFALMIHLFTIGIQVNTSKFRKPGRPAIFIGTTSFLLPYMLGFLTIYTLNNVGNLESSLKRSLSFIAMINSVSSSPVITSHLTELRILNSEIGRLASNACVVSEILAGSLALGFNSVGMARIISKWESLFSLLSTGLLLALIFFIIRPAFIWSSKHARGVGGDSAGGEFLFIALMIVMLSTGLLFEVLGGHGAFGTLLLGIALPEGLPLGATLVNKIEAISAGLLIPSFTAIGGMRTDFSAIEERSSVFVELLIMMGYIGKFCGTLLSATYCGVHFRDAVTLALIMCCKGIIEVAVYVAWRDWKILDNQCYTLLVLTMLIVTAVARPIVSYLYDPSKKYTSSDRRSILHSGDDTHLRILVCIHNEDNVPIILNLLEASNPTPYSPISVFTLRLQELQGRAAAVLAPHHQLSKNEGVTTHSEHFINAFEHYEQLHGGSALVQHFISIAPYASMYDDVCTLAMDKRTTIVILPFHKQWAIDGTVGFIKHRIRNVNRNVMNKVPCSVGVLIDRTNIGGAKNAFMNYHHHHHPPSSSSSSSYRVGMLFLGGADDREALAYSRRMANHPRVTLDVVWVKKLHYYDKLSWNEDYEDRLDEELMSELRATSVGRSGFTFREETVKDGVGTTEVICSLEGSVDLLLVGRHHDLKSPLMSGIAEWSECPELGPIGDTLATSDFKFSVLVVQQQPIEASGMLNQLYSVPAPIDTCQSDRSCSFPNSDDPFLERDE